MAISLLLPVVSTIHPRAFDRAMRSTPRIRDWRFSSVSPVGTPPRSGPRSWAKAVWAGSMGTVTRSMPSRAARASASVTEPPLEYRDGMATPWTWSAPTASTATAATREESIPPDRPMTASVKPFLRR